MADFFVQYKGNHGKAHYAAIYYLMGDGQKRVRRCYQNISQDDFYVSHINYFPGLCNIVKPLKNSIELLKRKTILIISLSNVHNKIRFFLVVIIGGF